MTVLALAPMAREARAVGPQVVVCGAGAAARASTEQIIGDHTHVHALVLFGVCGALDPSLRPGDLIVARCALSPELAASPPLIEAARAALRDRGISFVSSRLLTVDEPVVSRGDKIRLWNETGAAGVDMETRLLVGVADERGVPWLAVRAVVDHAGQSLPRAFERWRSDDEAALLPRIALSPSAWLAMPRLAFQMRRALASLRRAASVILPALDTAIEHRPDASSLAVASPPPAASVLSGR